MVVKNLTQGIEFAQTYQLENRILQIDDEFVLGSGKEKIVPLFVDLFSALSPLLSDFDNPKTNGGFEKPTNLESFVANLVNNFRQNLRVGEAKMLIRTIPPALIDNLDQPILLCRDLLILHANPKCKEVWGYEPYYLLNQNISVLVDLSAIGSITRLKDQETIEQLITYHVEGYPIPLQCTKVNTEDSLFYLSFKQNRV